MPAYNFSSTSANSTTSLLDMLNIARQKCVNASVNRSHIIGIILDESSKHNNTSNCSLDMKELNNNLKVTAICQKTQATWRYQIALPTNKWTTAAANWVSI